MSMIASDGSITHLGSEGGAFSPVSPGCDAAATSELRASPSSDVSPNTSLRSFESTESVDEDLRAARAAQLDLGSALAEADRLVGDDLDEHFSFQAIGDAPAGLLPEPSVAPDGDAPAGLLPEPSAAPDAPSSPPRA